MKAVAKRVVSVALRFAPQILRTKAKEVNELMFWRGRKRREGTLSNDHYEQFFTTLFDLAREDYAGQRVADIGCGPRGSLEWASMAAERVGVDPLAERYLGLGADRHAMRYVAAGSEDMPFADGYFDIVSALNALDHVENVDRAIAEIERITRPGGAILLIVEINHAPTITEPQTLRADILDRFTRCAVVSSQTFAIRDDHDVYRSILDAAPQPDPRAEAILCARLRKRADA